MVKVAVYLLAALLVAGSEVYAQDTSTVCEAYQFVTHKFQSCDPDKTYVMRPETGRLELLPDCTFKLNGAVSWDSFTSAQASLEPTGESGARITKLLEIMPKILQRIKDPNVEFVKRVLVEVEKSLKDKVDACALLVHAPPEVQEALESFGINKTCPISALKLDGATAPRIDLLKKFLESGDKARHVKLVKSVLGLLANTGPLSGIVNIQHNAGESCIDSSVEIVRKDGLSIRKFLMGKKMKFG